MAHKSALINDKYSDFSFYKNSMSLLLQGDYGVTSQIKVLHKVQENVLNCADNLLAQLNAFFDENNGAVYDKTNASNKWLDMIGSIYGLYRDVVMVEYYKHNSSTNKIEKAENPSVASVELSDYDFATYIQARIANSNFNGTAENILQIYKGVDYCDEPSMLSFNYAEYIRDAIAPKTRYALLENLGIVYIGGGGSATCKIALTMPNPSQNLLNLFTNGLLTIESMGIKYDYYLSVDFETATFGTAKFFDSAKTPYYIFARGDEK